MSAVSLNRDAPYTPPLTALLGAVRRIQPQPRQDPARRVDLYTLPPTIKKSQRTRVTLTWQLGIDPAHATYTEREEWILSMAEMVLPGLAEEWKPTNVTLRKVEITQGEVDAMCTTPDLALPPPKGLPAIMDVSLYGSGDVINPNYPAVVLAALLFAVVKGPNDLSAAKYVTNRFSAACAAANIPSDARFAPLRTHYDGMNAAVNANPALRERIAGWAVNIILHGTSDPVAGTLISQARLWRRAGSMGMEMVSKLLVRYHQAAAEVPSLRDELEAFDEHVKAYCANTDDRKEYFLAIYGPRNPVSARRNYSQLVAIARHFDTSGAPSMKNFAGTRKTPSLAAFEDAARRLGIDLTTVA